MLRAVADTHAIIWYLYDDVRLSHRARDLIEHAAAIGDQIGLSAITLAELVYLTEKDRMHPSVLQRLFDALDESDAVLRELPFDRAIASEMRTIDRNQVPDLPDRIIAATGQHYQVPIISRDRRIQHSSVETIW